MITKTMLSLFFMSVFFVFQGYVQSEGSSIISSNSSTEIMNTTEQIVNEVDKKTDSIINDDKQNSRQEGFIGDMDKMHEVIYRGFQFSETPGSCDDGRAYSSFANCTDDCERRKEKLFESIYPFAYPFTHKVLFLFSNEFSLTSDNNLKVSSINMNIPNDSYVLYPDGTARACLPLIKDLETCNAWNVEPKLLEFDDNGNRMWHKDLNRYYKWNEFFLMQGDVIICDPERHGSTNQSLFDEEQMKIRFAGDLKKMHELIYSDLKFSNIPGICDDGRTYWNHDECIDDCQRRKEGFNETSYPIPYPFKYKVLFLFSNEFSITNEQILKVPSMDMRISNDSYVLYPNGTARACLPLVKDLETCQGWNVDPNLLQFDDNGNMWHKVLRRHYNWSEFFFMKGDVIICEATDLKPMNDIFIALLVGNILSTICLCLGVILSRLITDLKKNILLQCHIIMLALAFIVATYRSFHPDSPSNVCIVTSALHQFLSLSAFFWVNIQSFDLLTALRGIRINKKISFPRLLAYSAFACGIPCFLTTFAVTAEILEHPVLRPGFKIFCYFSFGTAVSFGYYFGWMGLSIFVNLLLFILIVFQFRKKSQEVSMVNRNTQKQLFIVSIKLVFTMGFIWIFSVISWTHADEGIIIWCLNVTTSLQGVFVFLIYIFKIKYLKKIVKKFPKTSTTVTTKPRPATSSGTDIATPRSSVTSLSTEYETVT